MPKCCAGCCDEIMGAPYSPGCSYGCEIGASCEFHEFCSAICYYRSAERADQNNYARFHEGL